MRTLPIALLLSPALFSQSLQVLDFGAAGNGITNDTAAIQRAIDRAAETRGGTVELSAGRYLCGTLFLRNGVRLYLDAGAVLVASPNDADFAPFEPPPTLLTKRVTEYLFSKRNLARAANLPPTEDDSETTYMRYALIVGEDVSNAGIEGPGRIDGNRTARGGPKPLAFKNARDITIRDVTILNAPNYAISLLAADFVTIDNVKILNAFADGIDPDNCHYVRIANAYIDSRDDGICPKASLALGRRRSTEHLTVTNSIIRTQASAFKFGTESAGDFRHVTVSNLTMLPRENATRPPTSGIALESVDGANIEAVTISNITMREVRTPIFLRLGARGRGMDEPRPGTLRDVIINNVVATGAKLASSITAVSGAAVEDITLSNIHITTQTEPAAAAPSLDVPEHPDKYPEATMFGDLPASALYVRRAQSLRLDNLTLRTSQLTPRPIIVLDEVDGATITSLTTAATAEAKPVVFARKSARLRVEGNAVTPNASGAVPVPSN